MKTFKTLIILLFVSFSISKLHAQVGIGTTTPAAALDITSTTDGLLIPRIALTGTNVVLPVITGTESEMVYNTATVPGANSVAPGFYYLLTSTGPWVPLGGAADVGWYLTGNAGTSATTNFLGTTDNVDMAFKRNNAAAGKIGATSMSIGVGALTNGAATNSTAIGNNALSVGAGINNVAVGQNALQNNTGSSNIGIGLNTNPAGGSNNNIAIGNEALFSNGQSSNNVAIGYEASRGLSASAANSNVTIGYQSMRNTSGNVVNGAFLGAGSGLNNKGNFNTGIGKGSLGRGTSTGQNNTGVGHLALEDVSNGNDNTALGSEALYRVTTGGQNTGIGYRAGGALSGGIQNTFVGYQAASAATGSNNTAIGYQAQVAVAGNSNQIRVGDSRITLATTQVAWTNPSDRRWKDDINNSKLGLDFIKTLRPVSYVRKNDKNKKTEYGFIAQELEEALIKAGDVNNGVISKDDEGMYGVRYNDFIPMTVKAVQEQQVLIEKLQKDNEELKATNAAILKRLDALEKRQ